MDFDGFCNALSMSYFAVLEKVGRVAKFSGTESGGIRFGWQTLASGNQDGGAK